SDILDNLSPFPTNNQSLASPSAAPPKSALRDTRGYRYPGRNRRTIRHRDVVQRLQSTWPSVATMKMPEYATIYAFSEEHPPKDIPPGQNPLNLYPIFPAELVGLSSPLESLDVA